MFFYRLINNLISKKQDWLIPVLITALGTILRIHDYSLVPEKTYSFDEYAFAWSGMSLIKDRVPTSWSYLSAYPPESLINVEWLGKKNLYLATPWFDHPPLFGLIIGAFAILAGANTFWECTTEIIRVPLLFLGSLSIFLFYLVANKLFSTRIAVIATLIFATDPLFIYLSRLTVSENLLVVLSLGSLFCFLEYLKTSQKKYFYICTVLVFVAPLVKITGLFIVGSLFLMLAYNHKLKEGLIVLASGILGFSVYFAYGWFYDFQLFITVLRTHSKRFSSILIFKDLIFPNNLPFPDAWLILGWLTLPYTIKTLISKYKIQAIFLPITVYTFLLLFSGAQSHFYAWYTIPFYPFIFLSLGKFMEDFLSKPNFISSSLIMAFVGTWCLNYGLGNPWSDYYLLGVKGFRYIFIFTFAIALMPFFLQELLQIKKIKIFNRLLATIIFTFCIFANILIVYNLGGILKSNLIQ